MGLTQPSCENDFSIEEDPKVPRKYVPYANTSINKQIDRHLRIIKNTILSNLPGVKSIIIAGGFGKSEGSIKIANDGTVTCLRDFDFVCIVDRKPSSRTVEELENQIYMSLGIKNPASCAFERGQSFVVDLKFLRKNDLIYPDIYFYDIKAASQVLWGEDVRGLNPWTKKDVPLSSGLRVLYEKVTGLLGYFSADYLNSIEPTGEEAEYLLSECHKTFIEIGTAMCILAGKYEPKYSQRAKTFTGFFVNKFPELFRVLPELPKKLVEYTNLRLSLDSPRTDEDPVDLWFSTRDYLEEVLKFYVEKYTGEPVTDWTQLPKLMRIVSRDYYKPFLGPLLCNRLNISNKYLLSFATFLYQGLTNVEYSYVVGSSREGNPLNPLKSWYISPSLKYFTSGALLLFSLNRDATVKGDLLKAAQEELSECIGAKVPSFNSQSWEMLRIRFLTARDLYRGYHFVK